MTLLSSRLDRLPFSSFHRRLLVAGGLGYTFDAMDSSSLAFMLPVLRNIWRMNSAQVGLLASSTYMGYFFGAFSAGVLGDIIGRKKVMMGALAIYTVAALGCVVANNLPVFFALRLLSGFGVGAESAIVAPYLSEFVSKRFRGQFTGALAGFFSFGYSLAALCGYLIIGLYHESYKWLLFITALPILMLLWWRRTLPESPRWLEARGDFQAAEQVIAAIEAEILKDGQSLDPAVPVPSSPSPPAPATISGNLAALWYRPLMRVTACSWLVWMSVAFSYYAFFTWLPSLLVQNGASISRSYGLSVAIYAAQVPGYFSAAYLNERLGRRGVIGTYMLGGAVAASALALSQSPVEIVSAGIALSFFMNGTFAGLYAYTAEIFPTRLRATGMGTSSAVGRVGAITAPILVGIVYPVLGFTGVFAMTTSVLMVGALVILLLGVQTTGRSLEEIGG